MSFLESLASLLFPPRCAFCGKPGVHGVCSECEKALPYCKTPLHERAEIGACLAPLKYEGIVREALLNYKFHASQSRCTGFGDVLAQAVAEHFGGEFDNDYNITEWLTQYSEEKDVTYVRGFLGRMLFSGEDGVKKVAVLSGGEKVRCLLSKMMISGANVLLLDEPTNHLDMESITALNNGLIKFPGVLLFTSRDHQIVQTTANRIMEIVPGGKLIDKITTYDEYLASEATIEMRRRALDLPEDSLDKS